MNKKIEANSPEFEKIKKSLIDDAENSFEYKEQKNIKYENTDDALITHVKSKDKNDKKITVKDVEKEYKGDVNKTKKVKYY